MSTYGTRFTFSYSLLTCRRRQTSPCGSFVPEVHCSPWHTDAFCFLCQKQTTGTQLVYIHRRKIVKHNNNSFDLCVNTFGYVSTLFLALWNWRMCIRPCEDDVPKGVQFCEELVHGLAALIHHLQHDHQAVPRHNLQQTQSKSSEHGWKTSLNKEYTSTDV